MIEAKPESTYQFIGDGMPIVLHVLHSWGGGIECFAKDLQAGDKHRKHLFLKSHSRDNSPPFGKELCLYANLNESPIASWTLSEPIMDTDVHSAEVVWILQSIIEKWAVGAIIVSSLIGQSLNVLRMGLPTALVIHDLYPFWPILHDAETNDYSSEALSQSLLEDNANVFLPHGAEYWLSIRDELVASVQQPNVVCISPSVFAKERVCRIDSRLNHAQWRVIPHGIEGRPGVMKSARQLNKLKVLVPGHINEGKGEVLLDELMPQLPDGVELVLLGSAHLSEKYASDKMMAIADYQRERLPELIAELQPDIALLPSTVPETYGYVLSEMLQLGVPVICSNIGAYAERGMHLPGITLVEPKAEHFRQALIQLRDDPELLPKQSESLPFVFPNLQEMADAWASALPAKPPEWRLEFSDDVNIDKEVEMNLRLDHLTEVVKLVHRATEKSAGSCDESRAVISRQQSNIGQMQESMNQQQLNIEQMQESLNQQQLNIEQMQESMRRQQSNIEQMLESMNQQGRQIADLLTGQNAFEEDALNKRIELQAKIVSLSDELTSMQAKRGWRFLSFFK